MRPSAIDFLIWAIAAGIFGENSNISIPASKPKASPLPSGNKLVKPFIFMASEYISPSNPNSLRNTSVTIFLDNVEGKFLVVSKAGILKWAIITPSKPLFISSLNGYNSTESSLARLCGISGST